MHRRHQPQSCGFTVAHIAACEHQDSQEVKSRDTNSTTDTLTYHSRKSRINKMKPAAWHPGDPRTDLTSLIHQRGTTQCSAACHKYFYTCVCCLFVNCINVCQMLCEFEASKKLRAKNNTVTSLHLVRPTTFPTANHVL